MNILEQYRQAKLIEAAQDALTHVSELREAWQRGNIHEFDNQGGTRSNRNVEVEAKLQKALHPFPSWNKPPDRILDSPKLKAKISEAINGTKSVAPFEDKP